MESIIEARGLQKIFKVPERDPGLKASLVSLVRRRHREVRAVDGVSISVAPGEIVGFLGPNGAGKTTTLKMFSGLLHPSGGELNVLGFEPYRRQREYLSQMTLVMGNRNQLAWDLPIADSFEVTRAVYGLDAASYRGQRDELVDLLDLGALLSKPVRNLSLGERMKAEIANSLLHQPKVLFLDEPTLGLDVTMQRRVRTFLRSYNERHGASIMLTSHYMADVEALCERVVVIHHGTVLFDGPLAELSDRFGGYKTLVVTIDETAPRVDYANFGTVMSETASRVSIQIRRDDAASVTGALLAQAPVLDLTVENPPIDDVIESAFAQGGEDEDRSDGF